MNRKRTFPPGTAKPVRFVRVNRWTGRIVGRRAESERKPFSAGHPVTWGLLTNGTPLEGSAYPFPIFDLDVD